MASPLGLPRQCEVVEADLVDLIERIPLESDIEVLNWPVAMAVGRGCEAPESRLQRRPKWLLP